MPTTNLRPGALAAFAIVFAAGVVSTATLGTYIGYLRRKGSQQPEPA